ncbi:MAG: tRNA methyltransferase [Alphaproteobacteria bacterium]|nr:tRNA methyltransferase [Alphaproteobacteria bacterium]
MPRIVLFEPDIPQNAGTIMRLAACFGLPLDIIEPCGFVLDDRRLARAGMDYRRLVALTVHASWRAYRASGQAGRLVVADPAGTVPHTAFAYAPNDRLLFGRESVGVDDAVREAADALVRIPMRAATRSLNVAVAAAIVTAEALRQTGGFPTLQSARTDE